MTDSAQSSPGPASTLTCGNCGAPVQPDAVTCPACGVLLAAYQAPAGAAGNEAISAPIPPPAATSATREIPSPAMPVPVSPATASPPRHQPRSQSPIGDALRRSRDSGSTGPQDLASDDAASELARMAADDSPLAREVEAELAGAKVTFDGAAAVIQTDRVDVTHSADGAPVVAGHAPVVRETPAVESVAEPSTRPQPVWPTSRVAPVAPAGAMDTPVGPNEGQRPALGGLDPATVVRRVPFVLIGCFVLGFGRSLPGFGGIIGVALVIGLIYVLIKVAAASSRKTTSMPRDESWHDPRSRGRK